MDEALELPRNEIRHHNWHWLLFYTSLFYFKPPPQKRVCINLCAVLSSFQGQ